MKMKHFREEEFKKKKKEDIVVSFSHTASCALESIINSLDIVYEYIKCLRTGGKGEDDLGCQCALVPEGRGASRFVTFSRFKQERKQGRLASTAISQRI